MTSEIEFLHDLTSPLMSAMLRLEIQISEEKKKDPELAKKLEITFHHLVRLAELIQQRKNEVSGDFSPT